MTDTTPAAVERANGAYVHHSDYAALSAQLEAARAEGKAEGLRDAAGIADKSMRKYALAAYQNDDGRMQNAARTYCADGIRAEILALIPAETPAAKVTLGFLRPIWKDHSGEWHGPKVERWSIPEDQMVTFFNAALRAIAGGRND